MRKKRNKFNIINHQHPNKKTITTLNKNEKNLINEFINEIKESRNGEFDITELVNKIIDEIQSEKNQVFNNGTIDFEKIRWKNGIFCPRCKSKKYWSNRWSNKKVKLYKCKVCRKTFSFMTNTFLSNSKLPLYKWSIYIKCFIEKLTCRQTSDLTEIHPTTAWRNQQRILKWLFKLVQETKLNGDVILDEFFIAEAYKGRWKQENKPKRLIGKQTFYTTYKGKLPGLSRFKVCFISGLNEKKEFFFKEAKFGKLSFKVTFKVLDEMLDDVNQITSNKEQAYRKYTVVKKIKHIAVKVRTIEAKVLNDIDFLHYNCRKFFRKF